MKRVIYLLSLLAGTFALDQAPYLSRAELLMSVLNVTIHDADKVSDDHIFLSPWSTGDIKPSQAYLGPHIFASDGELVWSGYGYSPNSVCNFMPIEYQGQKAVSFFEGDVAGTGVGFGTYRIIDNTYQTVKKVGVKSSFLHDFHEFNPSGADTAVLTTYRPVPYDLSNYDKAMVDHGWVYECMIMEINTTTDEILFEWNSLDHVDIDTSMVLEDLEKSGNSTMNGFDYMHMNAIEKDDIGNYLISARHLWTLFYIDGNDGHIIWHMGRGKSGSDWNIDDNATFAYQHHARWIKPEQINMPKEDGVRYLTLFDNEGMSPDRMAFRNHSRGLVLKLDSTKNTRDHEIGKVSPVQEFLIPGDEKASTSQGSVQPLDNGNFFINWGSTSVISEHLPDGKPVFKAIINAKEYPSYRGFKAPFEGNPTDTPALLSRYNKDSNETTLYFSWNGATKVSHWNVYTSDNGKAFQRLETIDNEGFEMTCNITGSYKWAKVEALDHSHNTLASQTAKSYTG
ncbi:hypothetical protein TRICI_003876 [Trichomonascus ciferrii]|uniref:Uncharacterized protein n=1 Tax=Trichomonascus ciferrii TaxID=44093 RepID=A0A642V2L8_9ASCO|nr:hypothetical protein TRICI_003876 [Trichomonascus ciferrii]